MAVQGPLLGRKTRPGQRNNLVSSRCERTWALHRPIDQIETGDTGSCLWNHGSLASSTMYRTGWAIRAAANDARRQLLEIASREFFDGTDIGELDNTDGEVHPRSEPLSNRRFTFHQILNELYTEMLGQTSPVARPCPCLLRPPLPASLEHNFPRWKWTSRPYRSRSSTHWQSRIAAPWSTLTDCRRHQRGVTGRLQCHRCMGRLADDTRTRGSSTNRYLILQI